MQPAACWEYVGSIERVKISRDGKKVCISDGTGLQLLDTEQGGAWHLPITGKFLFNLSPSGDFVIVSTEDGTLRIYNEKFSISGQLKLPGIASHLYISNDASKIAVLCGRAIYLLDSRLKLVWSQALPTNGVKVKLDNAGYHLACVDAGNLLTLYDASGKPCFARMFNSKITNLSLSSASEYVLVSTLEDRIFLLDGRGNIISEPRFATRIRFAKIAADGTKLIVGFPGELHYYTKEFTPIQKLTGDVEIYSYDASDNLGFVCGVSKNGEIRAYHTEGLFWNANLSEGCEGVFVTPSGEHAFVFSKTKMIKFNNLLLVNRTLQSISKKLEMLTGYGYEVAGGKNLLKQASSMLIAGNYGGALKAIENVERSLQAYRTQSKPELSLLGVTNESFCTNEWARVLLYIMNTGNAHCADIRVNYSQNILMKIKPIPVLLRGEIAKQVIGIKPLFDGIQKVSIHFHFWNFEGREFAQELVFELSAGNKVEKFEKPVAVIKHGNWEAVFRKVQEGTLQALTKCPGCKKEVQTDWVVCPYCMTRLKKW